MRPAATSRLHTSPIDTTDPRQPLRLPTLPTWDTWSEHQVSLPLNQATPLSFVFGPNDNGNVNLDSITLEPDPGVIRR